MLWSEEGLALKRNIVCSFTVVVEMPRGYFRPVARGY